MMTLQKCLMDQSDITALLRELDFDVESGELIVENPPTLRFDEEKSSDKDVIMPREEDPYGNA
jgi:hypothetical protein